MGEARRRGLKFTETEFWRELRDGAVTGLSQRQFLRLQRRSLVRLVDCTPTLIVVGKGE